MKLVRIDKLFDVVYGVNLDLNKLEQVSKNHPEAIPYIARSEKNNGLTAYVKKIDKTPNPSMTISVAGGGAVMSSFLQENPYYSGRDLFYLKPKSEMTKQMLLYYCTALTMNKFKFSYGRQANRTLPELKVPDTTDIPSNILNYNIDHTYDLLEFNKLNEKVTLNGESYIKRDTIVLERLDEIFYVYNGLSSSRVVVQPERTSDYTIPYIRPSKWQSTSYAGFVDKRTVPKEKVFPEESLYISTDGAGSHTYAYVSVEEFIPNSNVIALVPKDKMTLSEKLVYANLITSNRFKFSYGRKPKGERIHSVLLPKRM